MRSLEHDTLARRALCWFAARCGSFRGAHEVYLAKDYVADAVALGVLFHRHYRDLLEENGLVAQTITYRVRDNGDVERDIEGDIADYFVAVFEAKATRADFLATFGGRANSHMNRLTPVGNLHYVVADKGVCEPREVPNPWGLLVRCGGGLSRKKPATYCPQTEVAILRIAERLLWNRHNKAAANLLVPHCPECRGAIPSDEMHYQLRQGAWADLPADDAKKGAQ